jgi:hypothetical protein
VVGSCRGNCGHTAGAASGVQCSGMPDKKFYRSTVLWCSMLGSACNSGNILGLVECCCGSEVLLCLEELGP